MIKDLTNQRFGLLTAISCVKTSGSKTKWLCKCDCGGSKIIYVCSLTRGITKSCGCLMYKGKVADKIGQVFAKLTVISRVGNKWLCRCECGGENLVRSADLTSGNTTSCGCRWRDGKIKHGRANIKAGDAYISWCSMKKRCYSVNHENYERYGKRGVYVCEAWKKDFGQFLLDMGERPKNTTIDRKNPELNYTCGKCNDCLEKQAPANCEWSDKKTQSNNTRALRALREKPILQQEIDFLRQRVKDLELEVFDLKLQLDNQTLCYPDFSNASG